MDMEINFPGDKKVDAIYKGFTIKTDQPKHEGGEGSAPEPFTLFLTSIGTCTGYYVLSFCQKRNISTNGLGMTLIIEKNKETHMIKKIRIKILPVINHISFLAVINYETDILDIML